MEALKNRKMGLKMRSRRIYLAGQSGCDRPETNPRKNPGGLASESPTVNFGNRRLRTGRRRLVRGGRIYSRNRPYRPAAGNSGVRVPLDSHRLRDGLQFVNFFQIVPKLSPV